MSPAGPGYKIQERYKQGRPQYGPQDREGIVSETDPGEKREIQPAGDEGSDQGSDKAQHDGGQAAHPPAAGDPRTQGSTDGGDEEKEKQTE
jgi:hypothetical protein